MNIFITNYNPTACAMEHCLVHRNKMLVEYAQLMSTYHDVNGTWVKGMYKPTHTNHPSAKWVRESEANYAWLYSLWSDLGYLFLNREYKHHKSFAKLRSVLAPKLSNDDTLLMLAKRATFNDSMLAMPDKYKSKSIALSYQRYLSSKFKEWQNRSNPVRVKFEHGKPLWYND